MKKILVSIENMDFYILLKFYYAFYDVYNMAILSGKSDSRKSRPFLLLPTFQQHLY